MANPWINPLSSDNPPTGNLDTPAVTVTIADVPLTDQLGKVNNPDSAQDIYTSYKVVNRYVNPQHRYMLGITSPHGFSDQSVAFVQLAGQSLLWIADWTAMKTNNKPKIPNPTPNDTGWILLAKYYSPAMVIPNPADAFIPLFRISGTYVYGMKNPSSEVLIDTTFPRPPWVQETSAWRKPVPSEMFEQFIIDHPIEEFEGIEQA